jgi:glycerol-3-phosphate dehydrogenase
LAVYGTDADNIEESARKRPELAHPLHPALTMIGAQVVWAVRHEMARTLDDVLARRTRALFLNARAALDIAPAVARLMAAELGHNPTWQENQLRDFHEIAACFMVNSKS